MGFIFWVGIVAAGAFVVAYVFATTFPRLAALLALGPLLGFALLLVAYLSASTDETCHDCSYVLGRWWQPYLTLFFLGLGALIWTVAVLTGASVRQAAERGRFR